MFINPPGFMQTSIGGYAAVNPAATALFARMAVQPTDSVKAAIDQFYTDAYMFGKFDLFYLEAMATQQQALLNWPNSAYDGVTMGTVDFRAGLGFAGNLTDFYINTGWLPGASSQYQLDNCCIGGVIQDTLGTSTQNRCLMGYGASGGGTSTIQVNASGTNLTKARLNSTSSRSMTHSPMEPGHWIATSGTGGLFTTYRNITTIDSGGSEVNMTGWTSGDFKLYAQGDATGAANTLSKYIGASHFAGAALTATEVTDFYYALNRLLAAIGAETLVAQPYALADLAMTPNNPTYGTTINYALTLASGLTGGIINIAQSGTLTDSDFSTTLDAALTAACGATTGASYSGGVLTFTNSFPGNLTWSRTIISTPSTGASHILQMSSPSTAKLRTPYAALICGQPAVTAVPFLRGVNISGPEFSGTAFYPSTADLDYYIAHGFTAVRLPHKWERMQPTINSGLLVNGDGTSDAEKYKAVVSYLTSNGIYVLIDPHNYGGRPVSGTSYKIGDSNLPVTAFLDYWGRLIDFLESSPYLIFALMNEPNGIDSKIWYGAAKSATDYIRASKGSTNKILVPGSSYTKADGWVSSGNAARFLNFTDPLNNFSFEVHQYLDSGDSGTSGVCVAGGGTRINTFENWARTNGKTGFLGEFAGGDPTVSGQSQCATEIPNMITQMESGQDVWRGWAPWGGGPNWSGSYIFRLEPATLTSPDTPIMQMYDPFI